jgi:uncharacterized protein
LAKNAILTLSMRSFLVLYLLFCSVFAIAQDIPQPMSPPRLVNDFVGMLNATEQAQLEEKLRVYNDSTSTQIVVAVVKTTGDYPAGDYAFELGRRWGVGQKGKNNGLIILWATDDRKVFIATGYGLEGAIPDAIAKRIISTIITPEFKNQMYYRGLDRGTDEIIRYAKGEYQSDGSGEGSFPVELIILIIILFVLFIIIASRNNRGGGNRSRGGGMFFPYTTYSGWGSSSGSWGGGGGGGSDFGGFGGGSFGGGGAGGDY